MDIAALQESRFTREGTLWEEEGGYTFFWSGRPEEEPRESGVCLAIKNCLTAKLLTLPLAVNDWIQTLHIPLQGKCHLTIVNVYAATLTNPSDRSRRHFTVIWKPPCIAWQHPVNWWCWETSMLRLAGSAQCGLVWLDIKGSATVTAVDYCSSWCAQNSNCTLLTQCSDCQTSWNAHGCIPVQKAGISLTISSLNKETYLMFKSPGWSTELSAQQIIKWCGHCFIYQSNLYAGWMLLNHQKSWTPSNWSIMSVPMLWDPL